jgi:hypothetical protein
MFAQELERERLAEIYHSCGRLLARSAFVPTVKIGEML